MTTNNPALGPINQEAQEAFWAVVAKNFPNIKTGDFPMLAQHNFDVACSIAIIQWFQANQGEQA